MGLYEYIPRDRYITREELVVMTGLSDRAVRMEINELRKRPETVIISSSSKKGYKRPESEEELKMCLNESRSRVMDEIEKQKVLMDALRIMKRQSETGQLLLDF